MLISRPSSPSDAPSPSSRRKPNYALIGISCLILLLACWNFKRAEVDFYGSDNVAWWDETATAWSLPDLSWGNSDEEERIGVLVLGMHRSGTSMLAGLLATAFGYYTGEQAELIPPRSANVKGYFERFDMVRQNDRFLNEAKKAMRYFPTSILYTPLAIVGYNQHAPEPAEMVKRTMDVDWETALAFLNNEHSILHTDHATVPWIQKDPRMCITLRTWLPYLHKSPAVVMTYRHPAEVGHSVASRDRKPMLVGLKAWIAYNTAMIRNAAGLCTVVTKNVDLLSAPQQEVQRIVDELQSKCHVLPPPRPHPEASEISRFIDVKLQSARHQELTPCVHGKPHYNVTTTGLRPASEMVYRKAMRFFCDMESGVAFEPGYKSFPTGY